MFRGPHFGSSTIETMEYSFTNLNTQSKIFFSCAIFFYLKYYIINLKYPPCRCMSILTDTSITELTITLILQKSYSIPVGKQKISICTPNIFLFIENMCVYVSISRFVFAMINQNVYFVFAVDKLYTQSFEFLLAWVKVG